MQCMCTYHERPVQSSGLIAVVGKIFCLRHDIRTLHQAVLAPRWSSDAETGHDGSINRPQI